MIQEVSPQLYRVQIPLPDSPLKYLNSYFILGQPRNLIVDTGLNRKECRDALMGAVAELGLDLERTDFFITHMHADHFALVSRVITPSSRLFFNRPDAEIIEAIGSWQAIINYGGLNGFPAEDLEAALFKHPGYKFGSEWVPHLNIINDGDPLTVGDYHFRCLITPGHTLGHTCLWEEDKGLLLAGDHILDEITPNIQCWKDDYDPLRNYLASLDRVASLPVKLLLPGHRNLVKDPGQRIAFLIEHHHLRLDEILSLLEDGPLSAYETASRMRWDLKVKSWEEFPVPQKWFATGEAIAHLRYLEGQGAAQRHEKPQGGYHYQVA